MKATVQALKIVTVYVLFSLVWIFFSDRLLEFFVQDSKLLSSLQTFKGMFFVLTTALLLYFLIRHRISETYSVQKKLLNHEQRLEYVLEGANLGYWDWDFTTNEHWVNERWLSFLGLSDHEIINQSTDWSERIHPKDRVIAQRAIEQTIKDKHPYTIEFRMKHKNGDWVWIEGSGAVVEWDEATKKPLRLAGTHRNITERKKIDQQILFMALNDTLTSLPNREYLRQELDKLLAENEVLSFMFLDLDAFKVINDMYGHSVGDIVIQVVAKRFGECLKETDFLARVGGDEFVVITRNVEGTQALAIALVESLNQPLVIEHESFKLGVSIGIAVAPKDGHSFEVLLKNADTAMYEAKNRGKNNFMFYASWMTDVISKQLSLDHDLKRALENDEFLIYYQPQVNFHSGKLIGLEALVRWNHPIQGLIPPLDFIPRAEETHLIVELGEVIFEKVCKDIKKWSHNGVFNGRVAINISNIQLEDERFVEKLEAIHERVGVGPSHIELEITESCLMKNPAQSSYTLQKLENIGYRISVDDFGTGFSSLSYLKQLPLHKLKIDKSFIQDLPHDKDDRAITRAIIALAKALELEVLAEGVEDEAQKMFLINNGCDSAQGYLFGKPMNLADIEVYLRQN